VTTDAACGGAWFRGPVPTLYDGNGGPLAALRASATLLSMTKPEAVQIHSWSPRQTAAELRKILPGAGVICGFGVDSIAREVAKARNTEAKGINTFVELAQIARDVGAFAVVWNAEASWKRPPTSEEAKRIYGVVQGGLAAVKERFPALWQWHTAYDHPSLHSTYPWKAWLGPGSPILASLPQVYAAGEGVVTAKRGALPDRERRALDSWAAAVRAGWIKADDPEGTELDAIDVDWMPYYQLHHVAFADTLPALLALPLTFGWALPTRADREGAAAFACACRMHHLGFTGPTAVRDFQKAHGLSVDGIAGPVTKAAIESAAQKKGLPAPGSGP